jgi:Ca2+-transporting ATPase
LIEIINASVRGRTRFKVRGLYHSSSCKDLLERELLARKDIKAVSASTLTGNVLVHYNSGNTASSIALLLENVMSEMRCKGALVPLPAPSHRAGERIVPSEKKRVAKPAKAEKRSRTDVPVLAPRHSGGEPWHTREVEQVLSYWNTSDQYGLSDQAVQENSARFGRNVLPESESRSLLGILVDQFKSLPVALLGVAAGISLFTGGLADAIVIAGVIGINAGIGCVTESAAEKTIESLKTVARSAVAVVRNGSQTQVDISGIVPGDVLVLRPGTYIAADSRLIETHNLSVDESTLTGESLPVLKVPRVLADPNIPLADRKNMLFMGTLVTGGQGLAVVVATGRATELGLLHQLVSEAEAPETPMERQLQLIGNQLVWICSGICGVVFLIGFLRGVGFVQMFKTSIALAVSAVPEGLPAVATTTLALGIRDMRRKHVLIRRLDAVETLGSVQTICFDKTGTVTQNRMSVKLIRINGRTVDLTDGLFLEKCADDPAACGQLTLFLQVCVLCSESEILRKGTDYLLHGSSTENALIRLAISAGQDVVGLRQRYQLLKINHRTEDRHFMATLHHDPEGRELLCLKGNPIEVLGLCDWYIRDGKRVALTEEARLSVESANEQMAGDALRVLGFAYCDDMVDCDFEELRGLTWLGLVGMADPVREGVKDLIPLFHQAGIDTVMITGDQSSTAYSIGKELDLSRGKPLEILDSNRLNEVDPEALKALAERVHVFSRVSPSNKLQIVQALQRSGRVVAMTGDGINDGPALKAADIGVALGIAGTDVAREVADVILEKDDLETMILAVSQGRTIYSNIRKSLHFLLATNFSEIMVMFAATALGIGFPLTAMQLLWINLISDIFPGLALAMEQPEPDVLRRPPRDPQEPIVRRSDFKNLSIEAAVLSGGALSAYVYGMTRYGTGAQAGTMAFQTLTLGQLLHAISCRSEKHSIFSQERLPPNRYLTVALGGSVLIQLMTMFVPGLRSFLGLTPLNPVDFVVVGGAAVAPLLINEGRKTILRESAA